MRDIKFRAWNKGVLITCFSSNYRVLESFFQYLEEDAILQQFTGLQDKNGVDIYDGDIVKLLSGRICDINFINGGFGYSSAFEENTFIGFSSHNHFEMIMSSIEIIGNIHEHQNLLK